MDIAMPIEQWNTKEWTLEKIRKKIKNFMTGTKSDLVSTLETWEENMVSESEADVLQEQDEKVVSLYKYLEGIEWFESKHGCSVEEYAKKNPKNENSSIGNDAIPHLISANIDEEKPAEEFTNNSTTLRLMREMYKKEKRWIKWWEEMREQMTEALVKEKDDMIRFYELLPTKDQAILYRFLLQNKMSLWELTDKDIFEKITLKCKEKFARNQQIQKMESMFS